MKTIGEIMSANVTPAPTGRVDLDAARRSIGSDYLLIERMDDGAIKFTYDDGEARKTFYVHGDAAWSTRRVYEIGTAFVSSIEYELYNL